MRKRSIQRSPLPGEPSTSIAPPQRERASSVLLFIGHLSALLIVTLAPTQFVRGSALWAVPPAEMVQGPVMGMLFLGIVLMRLARWSALPTVAFATALFGATLLIPTLSPGLAWSRVIVIQSLIASVAFAFAPHLAPRLAPRFTAGARRAGAAALVVGLAVIIAIGATSGAPASDTDRLGGVAINTQLTPVRLVHHRPLGPSPVAGDGGGIAAVGSGFVLVTGRGEVYALHHAGVDSLRATRLPLTVPLDRPAFLADQPANALPLRLRVTGIVLDTTVQPTVLYVAHQHWNRAGRCFTQRVSSSPIADIDGGASSGTPARWRTIHETRPCIVPSPAYDDAESGGRLAWDASHRLLLTLGDMGSNGMKGPAWSQDPAVDYGKVLRLDGAGGATIFSIGHRNPQGLLVDRQGRVWSTEHGPSGGDELNLLMEGRNYGWPLATYGVDYGRNSWPLSPTARTHGSFAEPIHAFVPAIAISSILEVGSTHFPEWEGDLLVGSLRLLSLFRVRIVDSRVMYVEPILIRRRIRDLAEGHDGRIVMWTDGGDVVVLERGAVAPPAATP